MYKKIINYIIKLIKKAQNSELFKIYFEWLYIKTILFLLVLIYFWNIDQKLMPLWIGVVILIFLWLSKWIYNSIKNWAIFLWIWLYVMNISITNNLAQINNIYVLFIILISIFIIPLLISFLEKYLKTILINIRDFFKLILDSIEFLALLILNLILNIWKYSLIIVLFSLLLLIPITFLWGLSEILEPNYIYWVVNKEAYLLLFKIVSLYFVILAIYSALYYINFKKNIQKIIKKHFKNQYLKYLTNTKIYYFLFLYLSTFLISRSLILIT